MTKKLMILAAGALTALAFAALPTGASAQEMEAHCSSAPCVGTVESTGNLVTSDDSGSSFTCTKTLGSVTQAAATSTTISMVLTFEGCSLNCQNEGPGTNKVLTNTLTGHLITVTTGNPVTAGILLTGFNYSYECVILGFPVKKTVTGNLIGTFENTASMCGKAVTNHTVVFEQTGPGQQTHKTYTGVKTFDLLFNGTTASETWTTHLNYQGGKTVTITC